MPQRCAADVLDTFVTARRSQQQIPVVNNLDDVGSTKSAHLAKDLSLSVKGMYPLLDLITEQGSSGLGITDCLLSFIPTSLIVTF